MHYTIFKTWALLLCLASTTAKKSFTIVIDTTHSMQEEIDVIKTNIGAVLETLRNTTEVENYILIPFNDPDVGPPYSSPSPEDVLYYFNTLTAHGGHDCPEDSLSAIEKALEVSQPESYILLFTDAYAKDDRKFAGLEDWCRRTRSQITIFLTGKCVPTETTREGNLNVYYDIAKSCSGAVFRLEPTNLRHAFKFIDDLVKVQWNEIATHDTFTGYKQFSFTVDPYTKDFVISVHGDSVMLHLRDINDRTTVSKILDSRNNVVVRVFNPQVGEYRFDVQSQGLTSVTCYKRNELPFLYGFSTRIPKSLRETSSRPVPGWSNYILFKAQDPNIKLVSIVMQDADGNKNFPVPLEEVSGQQGLFYTGVFFEPNKSFQIHVSGYDSSANRNISVDTKKSEPQKLETHSNQWIKPVAEILELETTTVDYGTNVTFACKVTGYPTPTIQWQDHIGNQIYSESVVLEIPFVQISYATVVNIANNGTIYCRARNSVGEDDKSIEVLVQRSYSFEVMQDPKDEIFAYGTEGRLYCEVKAYPEATIKWLHNETELENSDKVEIVPASNMLVIKNMSLDDVGRYTCEAANGVEDKLLTAEVTISGLEAPEIGIDQEEVVLKPGDWIEFVCRISAGIPTPDITWKFSNGGYFSEVPDGVYVEGEKLKIASVTTSLAGVYRCEAINLVGQTYRDVTVSVQYGPIIANDEQTTLTIKEGEIAALPCLVDAMPPATVRWELSQDENTIILDNRHSTDEENTHRFEALWRDSGNYHCVAENDVGRAEKIIAVNVLVTPYIQAQPKTMTVRDGASIEMHCNVLYGNPIPATKWEFIATDTTTSVLSRGNSSLPLYLRNVSKGQEGTYLCIADNAVGSDTIRISLKIQQ